jgi:hypothetical protein
MGVGGEGRLSRRAFYWLLTQGYFDKSPKRDRITNGTTENVLGPCFEAGALTPMPNKVLAAGTYPWIILPYPT